VDIDKHLNNIISKEDLVSFIRDLPDNSTGIVCFSTPTDELDEDGQPLELLKYRTFGTMSNGDAFMMAHEAADMARGL
jgi:hypothetical protein